MDISPKHKSHRTHLDFMACTNAPYLDAVTIPNADSQNVPSNSFSSIIYIYYNIDSYFIFYHSESFYIFFLFLFSVQNKTLKTKNIISF